MLNERIGSIILGALLKGAYWIVVSPFFLLGLILDKLPSWFWPKPPEKDTPITLLGLLKEFKCTIVTVALIFVLKRYGGEMPPFLVLFLGLLAVFYFILVILEWAHSRFGTLRWIAITAFVISGILWLLKSEWPLHW